MVELIPEHYYGDEPPFIPGEDLSLEFPLVPTGAPAEELPPGEREITFSLTPIEEEAPNAWLYKFKAVDAITGEELNAKIIIDGFYSGKWTPDNFYLLPNTTYHFTLTKYGYSNADLTINTDPLP